MAKIAVAPLVGAWIEISKTWGYFLKNKVAPLVGAWIEIVTVDYKNGVLLSLPSWERGLKYTLLYLLRMEYLVAPLVGAWIEIMKSALGGIMCTSLPSWERGLKLLARSHI